MNLDTYEYKTSRWDTNQATLLSSNRQLYIPVDRLTPTVGFFKTYTLNLWLSIDRDILSLF